MWNLPEDIIAGWMADCRRACAFPADFSRFRQMDHITYVAETFHAEHVAGFWQEAKALFPEIDKALAAISSRDGRGGPLARDIAVVDGYQLSGCTAHSVLRAAQIRYLFGAGPFHIAEIGGGYGNLAGVLYTLGTVKSYTGFDLPEAAALQLRYLGWPESYWPALGNAERGKYDLAISVYSLSELDGGERDYYARRALRHSARGFHVWNWGRADWPGPDRISEDLDWIRTVAPGAQYLPHIMAGEHWRGVYAWGINEALYEHS